jgi:hypothetical protein
MKKGIIGCCVISLLFTMCKEQTEKEDTAEFSLLYGKNYVLKIDKVLDHPNVRFPADDLKETDYTATEENIQYDIAFSENGQTITLEPGTIHGTKSADTGNSLKYELDDGLFAGGRIIIWSENDDFKGEFTIYGSGVPIIKSLRGILE